MKYRCVLPLLVVFFVPSALVPFGMVKLCPDTYPRADWGKINSRL